MGFPIDTCWLTHPLHMGDAQNGLGSNNSTNLGFFAKLGSGVKLISPTLNPSANASDHGAVLTDYMEFELKELTPGSLIIDLGNRIIGANTVNRPGFPRLTVTIERDNNGSWYLKYSEDPTVDWTK